MINKNVVLIQDKLQANVCMHFSIPIYRNYACAFLEHNMVYSRNYD